MFSRFRITPMAVRIAAPCGGRGGLVCGDARWAAPSRSEKILCVNMLSMMIIENPANMLEMKNRTGMLLEYQRGWILDGAVRNKPPSPPWCRVDSEPPPR